MRCWDTKTVEVQLTGHKIIRTKVGNSKMKVTTTITPTKIKRPQNIKVYAI